MNIKIKGILLVMIFAFISTFISEISWFKDLGISSLIIAIILGMVYATIVSKKLSSQFELGVAFSSKTILRVGIVLYGFRLTFQNIEEVGIGGVLLALSIVISTFILGYIVGVKFFKMDREITILTSTGSAICGAAAVLATESVLKSQAYKSSIAVSMVVLFGTVSMFLYPFLYKIGFINFDQSSMGLYIGATLHEVAHVVGGSAPLGDVVSQNAIIVKMIRVMILAPFLLVLSFWLLKSGFQKSETKSKITIPWFAVLFIFVVGFNSFDLLTQSLIEIINKLDTFALTMAMSALGMQTNYKKFKEVGMKPIYLSTVLFVWLFFGGYILTKFFS